jgi:hypothetical protein
MSNAEATVARPLTPAERRQYESEGYLILRSFLPAEEIGAAAGETETLLGRSDLIAFENLRCWFQLHCDTDEWLLDSFEPVIDISPACARLAADRRLLGMLASLYGEEAILFHDRLIFKPPGAVGYKMHQDFRRGTVYPPSVVTVILPLEQAGPDNGCTEVFPGYHRAGDLGIVKDDVYTFPTELVDEARAIPLRMGPGDIALLHCLTPHRSAPNRTDGWRRQLFLCYNARSDGGDCRARYYAENEAGLKRIYARKGLVNTFFL